MPDSIITLSEPATGSAATISVVGASLLALELSGNRVIEAVDTDRQEFYSGVVMAPWSSRVSGGKWQLPDGRELQLPINEPDRNNALHGLVFDQTFQVSKSSDTSVELSIEISPTDGYPFHLKLAMFYELEEGELFCSFAVKNLSLETAPFGIAFHPYFSTSWLEGKALFQNDAETSFILNENLIATGRSKTASTSKDLSVGKAVVGAKLDDGFTDLKFVNGVSSTKLISESGQGVEVWQEDIFKHLVIYTTDVLPTKQGAVSAIAIEPSTSEVNAFNSKQDLLLLSAGETRSGSWGIRLT